MGTGLMPIQPNGSANGSLQSSEPVFPLRLIVPTRDSHLLLPRLVASLREQTFPHWRVTFIDGGSAADHRRWLDDLCNSDPRFEWRRQDPDKVGIYGAMNQGFALADVADWLLFWGSDDWAADATVLAQLQASLASCNASGSAPDLLVCQGRYYQIAADCPPRASRRTSFHWRRSYRHSLLLGSTPPHQATLIGPGARRRLRGYADGYRLSADLDYFLQLSADPGLRVCRSSLELVHMGDGGVSGQQTRRRLQEVRRAYRRAFGWLWWFPFLMRYSQRIVSRLKAAEH